MMYGIVRRKTVTEAATGAMAGAIWIVDAP